MKNTFLIYKPQKDGRAVLCTATAEEWLAAVNTNRNLPTEQRRYFISDCIEDGKEIDRKIAVGVYGGEPFFCGGCAENRPAILLRFVD